MSSPEVSSGLGGTALRAGASRPYAFLLAVGLALGAGGALALFFTPGGRPLFLGAGAGISAASTCSATISGVASVLLQRPMEFPQFPPFSLISCEFFYSSGSGKIMENEM